MPARSDFRQLTLFEREPRAPAPAPLPLSFRSYCSSSDGNCLALWTRESCLLIDCGVRTLRDCRAIVHDRRDGCGPIANVLVSHAHGDHLTRAALRVMQEEGIGILGHRAVVAQLRARHGTGHARPLPLRTFSETETAIFDFRISAIPISHAPGIPTFAFVIRAGHGRTARKVVVCTDLCDPASVLPHLSGADLVFVEANHDVELLKRHFNPNSRYHLNNGMTARLLLEAVRRGPTPPRHVVLGHLSDERNRDDLALAEVERVFARGGTKVPFELETAPKCEPSRVIRVR